MNQAREEFMAALPELLRRWLLVGVPTILTAVLLLQEWDIGAAIAAVITFLPIGLSLLGFLWIHPLSGYTTPSWPRWWFAVLWWLVTLLPTLAVGLILGAVVRGLLGVS